MRSRPHCGVDVAGCVLREQRPECTRRCDDVSTCLMSFRAPRERTTHNANAILTNNECHFRECGRRRWRLAVGGWRWRRCRRRRRRCTRCVKQSQSHTQSQTYANMFVMAFVNLANFIKYTRIRQSSLSSSSLRALVRSFGVLRL